MFAVNAITSDFHPSALADIYQDDVSMAIWQRDLDAKVIRYAEMLTAKVANVQKRFILQPSQVAAELSSELPLDRDRQAFVEDVGLVVDMFSCLFELEHVGVRLAVLQKAMCPKFHVDRVPCRLLCTYTGTATEWHDHDNVQRFDNGTLAPIPEATPNRLKAGDVALLKGEAWEGNEGRGLVHRSPYASDSERRLVLTLDFA